MKHHVESYYEFGGKFIPDMYQVYHSGMFHDGNWRNTSDEVSCIGCPYLRQQAYGTFQSGPVVLARVSSTCCHPMMFAHYGCAQSMGERIVGFGHPNRVLRAMICRQGGKPDAATESPAVVKRAFELDDQWRQQFVDWHNHLQEYWVRDAIEKRSGGAK